MDYIINYVKNRLKERSTINGLILIAAYFVMEITPDNIDAIIRAALLAFGISAASLPDKIGG